MNKASVVASQRTPVVVEPAPAPPAWNMGGYAAACDARALAPQLARLLDEFAMALGLASEPAALDAPSHDRVLLTMLFTDIVDSTQLAERLGDDGWRRLLMRHHAIVRMHLALFRGREIDTAGDGFFTTFDAPARAVRCAQAIRAALKAIGVEIRAGLHAGECELVGNKVVGLAVHVAGRVLGTAAPGEIRVSGTVKELVAGSGLKFSGGQWHELKGISDEWRVFTLRDAESAPLP
ncbi:adenylate/guanylate cyclase domain-containing protein [Variovorax sp. MHTC-1]|uniref:adenylate/guanylate cyclase domain-containing protein n=1 Tax=Variovorax sp. MHTC-1 TaxID=2495593 RepID=UPI00163C712C|nr:adenylate/guanylate cyclase domain-containing protein [Variovorax sp. MHTC-1]